MILFIVQVAFLVTNIRGKQSVKWLNNICIYPAASSHTLALEFI